MKQQPKERNEARKAANRPFFSNSIFPKLTVNAPNDKYEQEADAMADQVMRMSETEEEVIQDKPISKSIQRVSDSGFEEEMQLMPLQRQCSACEEEAQRMPLMRQAAGGGYEAPSGLSGQLQSSKGGGSPLPATSLQHMSSAFGTDFSGVRVHTGSRAEGMNQSIQAKAFTHGSDIYFNKGAYQPGSSGGDRLLAHELTHVVQQGGGQNMLQRNALECEAMLMNEFQNPIGRVVSGNAVHAALTTAFAATPGAIRTLGIPGGSAAPLRTQGLCGEDSLIIRPQIIGGRAGMGYPDLAAHKGATLEIAELKPASYGCMIDGEVQLAGYLRAANATDAVSTAWRTSLGALAVVPMSPSTFDPLDLIVGNYRVQVAWCAPGLLVYQVIGSQVPVDPIPVPVRIPDRLPEHENNWDKIKRFVEDLIESGLEVENAVRQFLNDNPELIYLIIGAGVGVIIATIGEDIITAGIGIIDDFVMIPIAATMIRVAYSMRALAR